MDVPLFAGAFSFPISDKERNLIMTIQINHVTKAYTQDIVLDDITMKISDGEHIAIVGENGCGKSTLLKIIAGIESYQEGEVLVTKNTKIAYLHQQFVTYEGKVSSFLLQAYDKILALYHKMQELEAAMSSSANVQEIEALLSAYGACQERFENDDGYSLMTSLERIAHGLHIDHLLEASYRSLSGGEKARVNLAQLLLTKADVLLLDEPTNHLDFAGIKWLERYLQNVKETIVIVSHDRTFINHTVKKIYEISWGELQLYIGDYDAYRKQKQERYLLWQQNYELQQKEIKRLQDAIRRFRQWGHEGDNEKFFKKAKLLEKRLEGITRIRKPQVLQRRLQVEVKEVKDSAKKVIELKDVSKAYGEKRLLSHIQKTIFWRERIAICGVNGAGKSTLIKMILQEEFADEGELSIAPSLQIGYLPQMILFPNEEERILAYAQAVLCLHEENTRRYLYRFGFDKHDMFKRLRMLSGGEKTRLKLALILHKEVNLLIFDEPTNHLDFTSIEIIEEILQAYKGTLLIVSHDRYFISKLCDKVWLIKNHEIEEYLNKSWMNENV